MDQADLLDALCRNAGEVLKTAGPIRRIRLTAGDVAIELEWPDAPAAPASSAPASSAPPAEPSSHHHIRAPLVGTFYRASRPGGTPFVEVGDLVEPGQQLGVVEAMKLMNPIEADRAGRVVDILVPDGTAVEFDCPLVALAPAADDGSRPPAKVAG